MSWRADRDVVADQVPVALRGVELGGKAAHVPEALRAVAPMRDQREAHRRLCLHSSQHTCMTCQTK